MICLDSATENDSGLSFPDLTALLDVMFILLVFLLLTAHSVPRLLNVALPEVVEKQAASQTIQQQVTLTIFADAGRWGLGDSEFATWQLFAEAALQKIRQSPDVEVVLAGDQQAPLQKVVKLFSWLQQQGVDTTHLLLRDLGGNTK